MGLKPGSRSDELAAAALGVLGTLIVEIGSVTTPVHSALKVPVMSRLFCMPHYLIVGY